MSAKSRVTNSDSGSGLGARLFGARIDDYVRVIVRLIRDGAADREWAAEENPYDVAAILNGSVNQTIIVWLLYRKPRDLMKGISSVVDRAMSILAPVRSRR